MKKEFQMGMAWENDTEYYATQKEYHVYFSDTVSVCDDRYVALRAHDTKEFQAFIFLRQKKNITLDFCGATLVLHGKIQPFLLDACENVIVKNCKITYDRPPFSEFRILQRGEGFVRLRPNPLCPCRVEDGKLVPYSDTWENLRLNHHGCFFQLFDETTRKGSGVHLGVTGNTLHLDPDWPYHPKAFTAQAHGEDFLLKGEIPDYYLPGKVLIISHENRSISNLFAVDCKDLRLENYRILCGWGMGIYTYRCENITLEGFTLTHDESSPCLVANSADAIHSFGTSGSYVIRNSVLEGMIDDALNIHSNFRTVKRAEGKRIETHLASCEKQANDLYRAGDVIAVYREKTMEEIARYTIEKIESVDEQTKCFFVDRPVAEHKEGDLIESLTSNCEVLLENCVFGKANSHLRLQSRGKFVMKNCEDELPLLLSGDASFWFESGPIQDLTVENCRFVGERAKITMKSEVMPSEAAPYYHRNLKVVHNAFETDVPMKGGYTDGIVFLGNRNTKGKEMRLELTNCGSVEADNCTVERKTEVKKELKLN